MTDDAELLRRYAEDRSEPAFTEFVQRNLNLVYFSALRRTNGDIPLAEDVTQQVFATAAQSATAIAWHAVPAGWLYVATRNAAANAMRAERRRKFREQAAASLPDPVFMPNPEIDWEQLRPQLDAVMDELSGQERDAVLLRCLQGRPFAEIGKILQITDEAARKRVDRALDKLRTRLATRGITSTSTALALALGHQATLAAPAALSVRIVGQALATAAAGPVAGIGVVTFMSTTKITLAVAGLLIVAGAGWFAFQKRAQPAPTATVATMRPDDHSQTAAPSPAPTTTKSTATVATTPSNRGADPIGADPAQAAPSASRPLLGAGVVRSTDWTNRGTATPAETLETGFWAFDHFDANVLASTLCFGDDRPQVDAFFATLSEIVRKKYPTPEQLLSALLIATAGGPKLAGIELTAIKEGRSPSGSTATLHLRSQRENGLNEEGDIVFLRTADGWRRITPAKTLITLTNIKFPSPPKSDGAK